jgi:uncharacterized alpha-E superfamily protein
MLSRVANSLYWMSRYIERAENNAHIAEVITRMRPISREPISEIRVIRG